MARQNRDAFLASFLQGLYQSGLGNPEVQRHNEASMQERNANLSAKMAEQGMIPGGLPNDHPARAKIGSFISSMFGGASSAPLLASQFKPDPNQPQYGMDETGRISMAPPGQPIQPGLKRLPPKVGETQLASQWRDSNSTPSFGPMGFDKDGNIVSINTHTNEVSVQKSPTGTIYPKTPSEGQMNAGLFATRANEANEQLTQLISEGFDPTSAMESGTQFLPSFVQTGGVQRFKQAKENFMRAVLRKESGMLISPEEMAGGEKQYFPQIGDKPGVIEQKNQNRETAIRGIGAMAGPLLGAMKGPNKTKLTNSNKPKTVTQNGFTYTLNPLTGKYE